MTQPYLYKGRAYDVTRSTFTGAFQVTDRKTGARGSHPRLSVALVYAETRATLAESERTAGSRLL